MAIIQYISPTQPTGSIDGAVYYKNGGQIALRSRSRPTVPTSNARTYLLNHITVLSATWEMPCTNADRIGWGLYAYNTPLTNAWGMPRYIRGYAHYMRSNRPRLQFGLPRIDIPPTTFGLPSFTVPGIYSVGPAGNSGVYFNKLDDWVSEVGAYLLGWISHPQPPYRTRPPEVYRPFIAIAGGSPPPAPPASYTLPSPLDPAEGYYWTRWAVSRADGRLSGL